MVYRPSLCSACGPLPVSARALQFSGGHGHWTFKGGLFRLSGRLAWLYASIGLAHDPCRSRTWSFKSEPCLRVVVRYQIGGCCSGGACFVGYGEVLVSRQFSGNRRRFGCGVFVKYWREPWGLGSTACRYGGGPCRLGVQVGSYCALWLASLLQQPASH